MPCYRLTVLVVLLVAAAGAPGQSLPTTGKPDPRYAGFDRVVMDAMSENGATAGMLAVRVNGLLVYERGFGWQDELKTKPTPPDAMCRIASMTKPITAAAVQMLISQGKVQLNTRVFDYLQFKPLPGANVDPRLKDITIEHLLEHRGGWDRTEAADATWKYWDIAKAMNLPAPPTDVQTVQYMMGEPLQFTPGERRAYSNLGYMILGLVIERASGQGYYDFCEEHILRPRGLMKDVRRLRVRPEEADPREVCYLDDHKVRSAIDPSTTALVPLPYGGFAPEPRRAVGGWVFTAAAYARFMEDFTPTGRPPQSGARTWHGGVQPGTETCAIWRSDGMKIVMFINHRGKSEELYKSLNAAADALGQKKRPQPVGTR